MLNKTVRRFNAWIKEHYPDKIKYQVTKTELLALNQKAIENGLTIHKQWCKSHRIKYITPVAA